MKEQRIFFTGLGQLGAKMLDECVRLPGHHHFLVGGRNQEAFQKRANLSLLAALQLGYTPTIECTPLDLLHIEQTAEVIARFQPDLIVCAATLQSSTTVPNVPESLAQQLALAPMGLRLPLHLTLMYKLMQAVRLAGMEGTTKVLNAIYPDVVHPVLAKVGLAPMTGVGDLANNVPALRLSVAHQLDVPFTHVEVQLVMARWVSYWMSRRNILTAPFHFAAFVQGKECTQQLHLAHLFDALPTRLQRLGGETGLLMTATSAALLVRALLSDRGEIVHAPGPNGLPGGYPVRVEGMGVEVVLPPGLTQEQALAMNEAGLRLDGIDHIDEQGTVFFTEEAVATYRRLLGYQCSYLPLAEVDERVKELRERYQAAANML